MGKSQSKSYDISTSPQKASHKRPKSSHERESQLLSARDSINLIGESQVSNQPNTIADKKPDSNGDNSLETKKAEINGVADSAKLESQEKDKTEKEEKTVITENKTEEENTSVAENKTEDNSERLEQKEEPSVDQKEDSVKVDSNPVEYNHQEESDQIDRALEEYIEAQKQTETVKKEDNIAEETSSKEEVIIQESEKVFTEEVNKEDSESKEETSNLESDIINKEELREELDKQQSENIEVIKTESESTEAVITEHITVNQLEDSDIKEPPVEPEEDTQEAQIDLEAEEETKEDTKQEVDEDIPVVEPDTEPFKTVISLETTPPSSVLSPPEADSREDSVDIVDPPVDTIPPAEPAIPVEEPTLPESASLVTSEITVDMPVVEAVVCGVDDLKDGEMKEVDVGEGKALLVRENGQFYAVGNKCTHYGAPLAKGALCNGRVRCPWHGACFNVKSGDIEDFPGLDSLPKFDVTIDDGKVKVKGDKTLLTSSKVQKSMCKQSSDNQKSVLIIGGGPASVMCAETLRKEGFTGKITVATQERHLPYDRVKLSKAMDSTPDGIALRNGEFYKTNDIDIQNNKKATSVDSQEKTVTFEDGSSLSYTSLVIATGGKPRQLPIPGADFENVCLLRTPDDANKIAESAKGKRVVIIGSSFIGMEVAAFLSDKAESISVVDIIKVPFQLVLGDKVGSVVQKLHEDQGVKFYFERGIKEFVGSDDKATEAVLSDDTRIPCDLAILGVGVVPATDFLKDSDINMTNRGFIPVDKNMKTNVEDIFAAGDIVEFPLFSAGDQQVNVQHWQMAHAHGKAAALGILEKNEDIRSVPFFWTMMYKKSIRYTGYGFGYDDIVVHGDLDAPNFVAFYTKGDEVVAVATLGADPMASQVAEIMYAGQKILKSEIQNSIEAITEKFSKL